MMVQEDVVEVNKTLTPLLSIVRQYLGELLYNSLTLIDASAQSMVSDKESVVASDDPKGDTADTPVVAMGKHIFLEAFFFNL